MVIRKSFWKVASLSKNVATLCMMADDHVASSVASDILIVNQWTNQSQQTVKKTEVIQEVISPEVIKLNQSILTNRN